MGYKYMRVLQINSVCGIGSTGRITTDIHKLLIEQGHESYIAYGRGEAVNCDNAIKIGNNFDVYKHVFMTRIFDKHGFGSKKATKKLIKHIYEINPDIIHLHNIHGYYINIEELFKYLKEANKPVVWTLHDCWAFTGHCAHFENYGCNKWENGCFHCPLRKVYPTSIFLDNSKDNYFKKKKLFTSLKNAIIVTPSGWLQTLVKRSFLNIYPVEVINNGIDLEIFKPRVSGFRERNNLNSKFIILGVASIWTEKKGFWHFIELSRRLKNDEIIILVGVTENQKKQLPDNIIGITRTNNVDSLAEIYSCSNVYVNATLDEVLGLTNLEALACGVPVITYNTGGSVECLDRNSGFIVSKGNLDELYDKISHIKQIGSITFKEYCRNRAISFYNKSIQYDRYIKLYESLIE